jgi:hypothetical protein
MFPLTLTYVGSVQDKFHWISSKIKVQNQDKSKSFAVKVPYGSISFKTTARDKTQARFPITVTSASYLNLLSAKLQFFRKTL